VNTAIGEIDTVRAVSNPSRIVTSADGAYMFTDNDAKVERIDDAAPVDLDAEGCARRRPRPPGRPTSTPPATSWPTAPMRGGLRGRLSAGPAAPIEVPASAAVASSSSGVVFSYSAAAGTVSRIDLASGRLPPPTPSRPPWSAPSSPRPATTGCSWTPPVAARDGSGRAAGRALCR
jgi:hypothetical protein